MRRWSVIGSWRARGCGGSCHEGVGEIRARLFLGALPIADFQLPILLKIGNRQLAIGNSYDPRAVATS